MASGPYLTPCTKCRTRNQWPRPMIDAVATSSSSSAMVAVPEQANGFNSDFSEYFSSIAGFICSTLTCPMVQLPNLRSVIS